jgi:ADP-heptose:LPS heptosyltransferase/predicted O-methyltransferase YrrM
MLQQRFSFVMIVLNGMPFIEYALRAIYTAAEQIIIIEGAVEQCRFAAHPDGSSTDGTVEAIRSFPDPERKISLVQGQWPEKLEMHNRALELVTAEYVWLVDADEIYKEEDIERVRRLLTEDPTIARVDFIPDNFWRGFEFIFVSDKFYEAPCHYRRVFRLTPGARFVSHRPPTLSNNEGRVLSGRDTRALNIYPYHYSYVLWSQVCQKVELYHRYGWGQQWGIDLDVWFRDFFLQWSPRNREELEASFPVWTGDPGSRTVRFDGEHPPAMAGLIDRLSIPGAMECAAVDEVQSLPVVGAVPFQRMVLRAWDHIQLDEPLRRRYGLIRSNLDQQAAPLWNIHVALAFLARLLRPERYLEVGVRTGGSMVQVLHNGSPRLALAVDQWMGSYAGMSNTLSFTRQQFANYQKRSGNATKITYVRGSSHKVLKRLIAQKMMFDLITIDGDHTREGAWEDLEDAVNLLGVRGAIVFDDITHPSHRDLYTLVHRLKLRYPEFSILLNTVQDNGCAIFLKNIDLQELFSKAARMVARSVVVAGEFAQSQETNLTSIDRNSEFARNIRDVFVKIRPKRVIETGTFHGNGTTRIIASSLRELGLEDSRFLSIECNSENLALAVTNLAAHGLSELVELIHGLSVPRHLLPAMDVIREKLVYGIAGEGIYVDHDEAVRTARYYAETHFKGIPDDRLGYCLREVGEAPDFILLDSGGHMGTIEFNYLLDNLKSPCYIALDDINHVKHARSFRQISNDPRFTLDVAAQEKFGFCIVRFTPAQPVPTRLLWIRTDAIGDNILSLPALVRIREAHPAAWVTVLCQEHIAELYSACPFVDEVLTFERNRAHENPAYRRTIVAMLQELRADICITPVLSREELTDIFALGSRALQRIAFDGNDCNINPAVRQMHNRFYTRLINTADIGMHSEFHLNKILLETLDIPSEQIVPKIWLTQDDEAFAMKLFAQQQLDPAKTMVFFPGAKDVHRQSRAYGRALEEFCQSSGFTVLIMGGIGDRAIAQQNLDRHSYRTVDLTGKTTIRQAAALIARSALAVGAETGLAHIAAAVGTPHVVLLGGGHFGRFMPYAVTTTAVTLPLDCFGCNWRCRYAEYYCIDKVSSAAILAATKLALTREYDRPCIVVSPASGWACGDTLPCWGLGVLKELDLPVTIVEMDEEGGYRSFEQNPIVPAGEMQAVAVTQATSSEYDLLLARYGIEDRLHPLVYCSYVIQENIRAKKPLAVTIHETIGYLKRWIKWRWNR